MSGRFSTAVVAFAVAAAALAHARVLPELFVQLHDPNLAAAPLEAFLVSHLGYAFVLALTAVMTGSAVLLAGWRTRRRGATDWYAGLAALLAALALPAWIGVDLAPIGWLCAAGVCLLLDRDDSASAIQTVVLVAVWSLLQGGATMGALLAVLALAGTVLEARAFTPAVRRRALVAAACIVFGALQVHAAPWRGYGAHVLFLDSLAKGAHRDRVWGGLGISSIGFAALIVLAGWYGIRRRDNVREALTFFALLLLALVDGRNMPYFGIACAPIVADAAASYYLGTRSFPTGGVRRNLMLYAAAASLFLAMVTLAEPRELRWPASPAQPSALLARLSDAKPHRILCTVPSWCDGAPGAVFDDRAGTASPHARRIQDDVQNASGTWPSELRRARVDAVIASTDDGISQLLPLHGWTAIASDGTRELFVARQVQP